MIASNGGVLDIVAPTVVETEVTSHSYPYLLALVSAPASPLGEFVYELEVDYGGGWEPPAGHSGKPVALRSGQRKKVPIYGLSGPIRYRLRTLTWEPDLAQLHGMPRSALLPLLDATLPRVREAANLALHHL